MVCSWTTNRVSLYAYWNLYRGSLYLPHLGYPYHAAPLQAATSSYYPCRNRYGHYRSSMSCWAIWHFTKDSSCRLYYRCLYWNSLCDLSRDREQKWHKPRTPSKGKLLCDDYYRDSLLHHRTSHRWHKYHTWTFRVGQYYTPLHCKYRAFQYLTRRSTKKCWCYNQLHFRVARTTDSRFNWSRLFVGDPHYQQSYRGRTYHHCSTTYCTFRSISLPMESSSTKTKTPPLISSLPTPYQLFHL